MDQTLFDIITCSNIVVVLINLTTCRFLWRDVFLVWSHIQCFTVYLAVWAYTPVLRSGVQWMFVAWKDVSWYKCKPLCKLASLPSSMYIPDVFWFDLVFQRLGCGTARTPVLRNGRLLCGNNYDLDIIMYTGTPYANLHPNIDAFLNLRTDIRTYSCLSCEIFFTSIFMWYKCCFEDIPFSLQVIITCSTSQTGNTGSMSCVWSRW